MRLHVLEGQDGGVNEARLVVASTMTNGSRALSRF